MKIKRKCPVCGVTYYAKAGRLKHGRQTTCSRQCSYILRADKLKNSIELICAVCGMQFNRPMSQIKGKHNSQFCSPACHYTGRTLGKSLRVVKEPYNISEEARIAWAKGAQKSRKTRIKRDNYRHTNATKSKLRDSNIRAISEGRVNTSSQLEIEVQPIIESMGFSVVHQFPIRDNLGRFVAVIDFFIPIHSIAIEVNGTFYHTDPRFYPNGPVHKIQKRNAVKWANKLKVIRSLNYTLIELWEEDIKKSGQKYIRQTIISAI